VAWARKLGRDGWLLFATAGLRSFAFGFVSVMLGPYLAARGLSPGTIGAIFTAALVGSAVMTVALARGLVTRLSLLFALDSFAGGFVVQGLVAYWFALRFGLDSAGLAGLF
jgi:hypothetical protein